MDANGKEFDAVVNALLRAQAVLFEVGSAMALQNNSSDVAKRILFEAGCARSAAYGAVTHQQAEALKSEEK